MNLKMKTLAAAMIAAGTLGTAQASSIVFPYVVNSNTVTTIVTVIDTTAAYAIGHNKELHWIFWYKEGAAVDTLGASCSEVDQWLPSSSNDIQTVDFGGKFGSKTLGVLFNDPSINNSWKSKNKRFDMGNLAIKPQRGYLLVGNEVNDVTTGAKLDGEAMVLEFATGAAWGYAVGQDSSAGYDFTNDTNITFTGGQLVSVKPWDETTTKFLVTPFTTNMANGTNNVSTPVRMGQVSPGVAMFDRDENPISGSVARAVTCVGSIAAESLISTSAKGLLPDGGWGYLNFGGAPSATVTTSASVIKLDYNTKATFNGEAVTGTFNNAFQLR